MKVQTRGAPLTYVTVSLVNMIFSDMLFCLRVGFSLGYKDEGVDSLLPLKEKLENPDHSVLYKTCADLTKVEPVTLSKAPNEALIWDNKFISVTLFVTNTTLCSCFFSLRARQVMSKRLPQQQLTTVVFMLFEGLVDSQTNCCRASSVILNTLLKNRGGGLQELV